MKRKKKITSADFVSAIIRIEYNKERLSEFEHVTEILPYITDLELTQEEETTLEGIQERLFNLVLQDEKLLINYIKQQN